MEYWNIGIMGINGKSSWNRLPFFLTQYSSIPLFQYSAVPPFQHSILPSFQFFPSFQYFDLQRRGR
jgi:hypothetical protein